MFFLFVTLSFYIEAFFSLVVGISYFPSLSNLVGILAYSFLSLMLHSLRCSGVMAFFLSSVLGAFSIVFIPACYYYSSSLCTLLLVVLCCAAVFNFIFDVMYRFLNAVVALYFLFWSDYFLYRSLSSLFILILSHPLLPFFEDPIDLL